MNSVDFEKIYKDPFARKFVLSPSMEMALIFASDDLNVEPEILLDSILLMFFWDCPVLYKEIVMNSKKEKK